MQRALDGLSVSRRRHALTAAPCVVSITWRKNAPGDARWGMNG